ncbi:MAG: GIY-YIG nuclease family protein [Negativicutes bacterium]|nr:GIY-YIG nuclease family protein [Negativicutes bacterium]
MDKRKELKLAYKQTPPPMGVFQISNKINRKLFIGSSMNLPGKKNSQWFQLKMGGHPNKPLQADWNLYGSDAFSFDILETIKPEEIVQTTWREVVKGLEDKWLANLRPYNEHGYNKLPKSPRD